METKQTLKILVVDDEPTNTEILTVMLEREGHQVLSASNAPMGVQVALETHPDLIFMDILMPGEYNGLEAIRRLKSNPAFTGKIICQSAKASGHDHQEGLAAGADGYLTKPFRRQDVLSLLEIVMFGANQAEPAGT
ncbi:Transcriptional regulatory protein YycF [compost metagenome]